MNDDAIYAKRCQSGETEAFGVLYDKYLDPIYRFIFYKTFSKEVAEDLTSDVFHKALEKIASFDASRGDFSTWLYRIARNRVIDYYRTKKTTEPIDDAFDMGVDERTPETLDAIRSLGQVTAYLETLDAKQREIIMLRVWEERSYREIAAIVGGTEDSVKMAFSRSIKAVREQCGPITASVLALASALTALPFYE
jgi:RNA polymerase sigma-70 factor (ECF subfamily)